MKKKALLSSILTIALCLSLIAGSTLALFTSKSGTNVAVTSGKVKVTATIENITLGSELGTNVAQTQYEIRNGNELALSCMLPGDYITFELKVANESNVTISYRTLLKVATDNGLWEGLEVTVNEDNYEGLTRVTPWASLEPETDPETVRVKILLPVSAGEAYQEKTCSINYTVEAIQGNAPTVEPYRIDESGVYHIADETGMSLLGQLITAYNTQGEHYMYVSIDNDMDMADYTWTPIRCQFVNIDGNGHTVKNLNCVSDGSGRSGFISYLGGGKLENITLENVNAAGAQAGVVAGNTEDGYIRNVTIKGTNTVKYDLNANPAESYGAVGAIFGYNNGLIGEDNSVTVATGATVSVDYNGLMTVATEYNNYSFGGDLSSIVTNNGNVTTTGDLHRGCTYVSTAADLAAALASGGNIVLANDIDMDNAWTTVYLSNKALALGGANHKITNLNTPLINFLGGNCIINDLTVENSHVVDNTGDCLGSGVILNQAQWANLYMTNCHVKNSSLTVGRDTRSGALVGYWIGGGEIKSCTVTNVNITNTKGSVGGIVGHRQEQTEGGGYEAIASVTDCTVSQSSFTTVDDSWRVGTVIGTVSAGDFKITNATSTGNILRQTYNGDDVTDPGHELYGRTASGGQLYVDGSLAITSLPTAAVSGDVFLSSDITGGGNLSGVYNDTTAVFVQNGGTIDGNGKTITTTASYGVQTSGGSIKNLTIKGAGRGIMINQTTEDVVIDNVVIDDCGYGINTAEHSAAKKLTVTNSTINGWSSWAGGLESASFTDCSFGACSYWEDLGYSEMYTHYLRPFVTTTFTNCEIEEGFYIDLTKLGEGCTVTFDNCTCNGVKLTNANFANYVKLIKAVESGSDVFAANDDTLSNVIFA